MNSQPKITKAFILAAGLGTRMRPLTDGTPKPLITARGKPLLQWTIDRFVSYGVNNIVINAHYKSEQITEYVEKAQQENPRVKFQVSYEEDRLETGGGVLHALNNNLLPNDESFFVSGSDVVISGNNHLQLLEESWNDDLAGLLLLQKTSEAWGYEGEGDFELSDNGEIKFAKPSDYVFTTTQILHPRVFQESLVKEQGAAFPLNVLYKNFTQSFQGVANHGSYYHIGTVEDLEKFDKLQEI